MPILVTTLVEYSVNAHGLLAEHGLCFHLQVGPRSLLFDTGQSDLLPHNALKLRLSLANTKAIVLSHGHNDHTGGLQAAPETAPRARFFLHRAALSPKFAGNPDGTSRSIGMVEEHAEAVGHAVVARDAGRRACAKVAGGIPLQLDSGYHPFSSLGAGEEAELGHPSELRAVQPKNLSVLVGKRAALDRQGGEWPKGEHEGLGLRAGGGSHKGQH